jgi:uncharacterized membrane protein YedE/YeeE
MKNLSYFITGVVFGLALTKGEAISWYRIQEMFYFQSFHMYGIFMTAVPVAALGVWLITKFKIHTLSGEVVQTSKKTFHRGVIFGGLIFGFGWALCGACPGPLYALMGAGYSITLITFLAALLGTWTYAKLQSYLPH